jgi:hypothetical protein
MYSNTKNRRTKAVPVYWKVLGKKNAGDDYWVASKVEKFYNAPTLRVYQGAFQEIIRIILQNK